MTTTKSSSTNTRRQQMANDLWLYIFSCINNKQNSNTRSSLTLDYYERKIDERLYLHEMK